MRLLVLYQAHDAARDQPGYYDGFERLVEEGLLRAHAAIAYYEVARQRGWDGLWVEAAKAAQAMDADSIFLQWFHLRNMPDPTAGILRLKNLPARPTLFASLGDPFGRWSKRVSQCFRVASRLADVSFLTGMGYLAQQLRRWGSRNLVLMPNGCCQRRFAAAVEPSQNPQFDVVFVGSRLRPRNPLGHHFRVARRRVQLVAAFTRRYGRRFGLFGLGWEGNPSWHGPVPYQSQHAAYREGAVALGGLPHAYHDYYTSDRVFIATASGVPLVDYAVPGVERILQPGVDWWLARDIEGMIAACDRLLALSSPERLALGERARQRALAAHTQYHRCRQMVEIVRDVRSARLAGRSAHEPKLGFLAEASTEQDAPPAIVAWQG
ncbi:MAG TPA: glycosyltransferase [Terriglobales bacterium]|nr:glycosyltransferase [Terriglobales bacterium]